MPSSFALDRPPRHKQATNSRGDTVHSTVVDLFLEIALQKSAQRFCAQFLTHIQKLGRAIGTSRAPPQQKKYRAQMRRAERESAERECAECKRVGNMLRTLFLMAHRSVEGKYKLARISQLAERNLRPEYLATPLLKLPALFACAARLTLTESSGGWRRVQRQAVL